MNGAVGVKVLQPQAVPDGVYVEPLAVMLLIVCLTVFKFFVSGRMGVVAQRAFTRPGILATVESMRVFSGVSREPTHPFQPLGARLLLV